VENNQKKDQCVDFERLKASGNRFKVSNALLVSYAPNGRGDARLGSTIPRYVGIAVVRNRLRRWCREFFRRHKGDLGGVDVNFVFIKKTSTFYKTATHSEVDEWLHRAVGKLGQIK
jgi:ribonuclease P protein component